MGLLWPGDAPASSFIAAMIEVATSQLRTEQSPFITLTNSSMPAL
jgi:hypothetical protein